MTKLLIDALPVLAIAAIILLYIIERKKSKPHDYLVIDNYRWWM